MDAETLRRKAELLRASLYDFWAAKLGDADPDDEADDERARELIAEWMRKELGVEAGTMSRTTPVPKVFEQSPHQ